MATSLAVASHHEGPGTEFAHAGTALPVNVQSPAAIAAALCTWLRNRAHRTRLASAGRAEVRQRRWSRR